MLSESACELWELFDDIKQLMGNYECENENKKDDPKCFNCGANSFTHDDGCIVCEKCGVDNGSLIDYQQEWRYYGSEDTKHSADPTRCGMPMNPLLPESSLATIILGRGTENLRRLNNWNSMTYKERSLLKVFKNIQSKSDNGELPVCIIDRAKIMYKTLSDDTVKRGKSRKGLIAACLYYSCKDKNISRSAREISNIFDLKVKKMTSGCKQFHEIMYHNNMDYTSNLKPTNHEDFIDKYVIKLGIQNDYIDDIKYVATFANKLGIVSENTPPSIAVGSIYLISHHYGLGYSKKKMADTCDISEVTISKIHKKMFKYKKFLLPQASSLPSDSSSPVSSPPKASSSPVSSSS